MVITIVIRCTVQQVEKAVSELVEMKLLKPVETFFLDFAQFLCGRHCGDAGAFQQKVQNALKEHAASVREPVFLQPVNATSQAHKTSKKHKVESAAAMWKRIYTNPELYKYGRLRHRNRSIERLLHSIKVEVNQL